MFKAGFIGCGNMGGTLASVAAKSIGGSNVFIADHHSEKLAQLKKAYGCTDCTAVEAAEKSRFLILGVKPQVMTNAADEIRETLLARKDSPVVVSMAAGMTVSAVSELLGGARVIRIMPNTPAAVGEGVILYCCDPRVTEEEESLFYDLLRPAGVLMKLPEEKIDAGSAISGCGPAFVCLLIEAMIDAGVRAGLPRDKARLLALQTFVGTSKLALQTGRDPAQLRAAVCSPAGSTIEGVVALEEYGARSAVLAAVDAAYQRTIELGKAK